MKFTKYVGSIELSPDKNVKDVTLKLVGDHFRGSVYITDVMFQSGHFSTGYLPANDEMLKRERDADGSPIENRHFNVIIRGDKEVVVPNRKMNETSSELSQRVTGGMDFTFYPTQDVQENGLMFSHQYETRRFNLQDSLKENDVFEFKSSKRQVMINGEGNVDYEGMFQTIPAGFGFFRVQVKGTNGRPGSGVLLCEPDQWLLGKGGARL
ncbi:hypothetical protein [Evansella halocellulosilytica]|uniref:hypothetical protein n=1 Tax=Evansella halocellulosilytica TaxID=2011013 RepID=UPI000BB67DE6|nr:hypothetical protein [Evansella halocellulosilytica]